jgi:hypothetical protein
MRSTAPLALLTLLGAATTLAAQTLPDCRSANLAIGAQCIFDGTTLPKQQYLGEISLPSSDHVRMTEPFAVYPPAPVAPRLYPFTAIGGAFTVQSETLGYKALVSSGGKGFGFRQWSDLRGLELRGTAVEFSLGGLGYLAGNNHTVAIAVGPRIQHPFGRVTPYGEILVGFIHQYYYGMTEGGVFGASVRLNNHLSLVPADVEYRYASLQDSTRLQNPRRGRIELSTGLTYRFGK